MGEDGARRVVVNSVGREIRTLEESRADRGQAAAADDRLRRAAAVEDGFTAFGYQRRRGRCSIRTTARCSRSRACRPTTRTRSPPGIDRATWAALNTDELRPLNDRAIQGRYSPGSTFKMAVATAALEEGVITPDFKVHCRGARRVLRPRVQVLEGGRPRHDRSAPRDRAVVQRLLLHDRQHDRASTGSTSGRRCSASA